jgi:hypothetical protein
MNSRSAFAFVVLTIITLLAPRASALIEVSEGNAPVENHYGWPAGTLEVVNLDNRLGYWVGPPFGGGEYHFEFRGDTDALQRTLELAAKIESPREPVSVIVHEGPAASMFLSEGKQPDAKKARYDWTFTVWDPKSYERLYNDPKQFISADDPAGNFRRPMPPPRIDVYVGGAPAGQGVDWSRVKVPDGLKVRDERASTNGYPPSAGSVVRGRVTDLAGGKPIAGARVTVEKSGGSEDKPRDVPTAVSGADGRFELKNVPAGTFRITASADGYAARILAYEKFGGDTLKEYADATLARAETLAGAVLGPSDKPLPGVRVIAADIVAADGAGYALAGKPELTTDPQGRFTLAGLPAGSCRMITFDKTHHRVDPLKRENVPATDVVIRMADTGNVRGKLSRDGGAPTDGPYMASITPEGGNKIGSWGGSTTVEADGTFKFENVPPGKYTVTARPNPGPVLKGKDPNARDVVVKAGETLDVEIKLKR